MGICYVYETNTLCVSVCIYPLFSNFEAYVTDLNRTWDESSAVKGHISEVDANLYHFNNNKAFTRTHN